MEHQDQKSDNPQPTLAPNPNINVTAYQSQNPTPGITDDQAQDLLALSGLGLGTAKTKSTKHPKTLLIVVAAVILCLLIAVILSPSHKTKKPSDSSASNTPSSKSSPLDSGNVSQEVQYCTNIVNANTSC